MCGLFLLYANADCRTNHSLNLTIKFVGSGHPLGKNSCWTYFPSFRIMKLTDSQMILGNCQLPFYLSAGTIGYIDDNDPAEPLPDRERNSILRISISIGCTA